MKCSSTLYDCGLIKKIKDDDSDVDEGTFHGE
jgi:hypothetical protein